jgi:hypothetical protein
MRAPLLRMLVWDSMAAFGCEVVPEVNWMLMISSGESGESGIIGREADDDVGNVVLVLVVIPPSTRELKGVRERKEGRGGKDANGW